MRSLFASVAVLLVCSSCRDERAGTKPNQGSSRDQEPTQVAEGVATAPKVPELTFSSGATWLGGALVYLGSVATPTNPKPGDLVVFQHYFVAKGQLPSGYQFFVHLVDAQTGEQLGNADHSFQGGKAPLESWPTGAIVFDQHVLQMPNYSGALRLVLGFYNEKGRLPPDPSPLFSPGARALGPPFGSASKAQLPTYHIRKAAKAPAIDGVLKDAAWAGAEEATLVGSFDGSPVRRKTTFKLLWDNEFIYAAFQCDDPDVWGTFRKHDEPIYTEEAVELFFDADGDGATYNEIEVSPHNVLFDAEFLVRRGDLPTAMKWNANVLSAVRVEGTIDDDSDIDKGWTVELKIPISKLSHVPHIPPRVGDSWRFNAYRLEHVVRNKDIEGQAFSPLFAGDFHNLPRFANLVFE